MNVCLGWGGRNGKEEGDGGGVREEGMDLVTHQRSLWPSTAGLTSCQTVAYEFYLNLEVS